ncbi:MAG: hypothetical protein HRU20_03975 [Pseudomonadales bacterium]|nr:hypothetical protein [Pseudomonadales bacterium]
MKNPLKLILFATAILLAGNASAANSWHINTGDLDRATFLDHAPCKTIKWGQDNQAGANDRILMTHLAQGLL